MSRYSAMIDALEEAVAAYVDTLPGGVEGAIAMIVSENGLAAAMQFPLDMAAKREKLRAMAAANAQLIADRGVIVVNDPYADADDAEEVEE